MLNIVQFFEFMTKINLRLPYEFRYFVFFNELCDFFGIICQIQFNSIGLSEIHCDFEKSHMLCNSALFGVSWRILYNVFAISKISTKKKYKVKVTTRCTHNISICRRMSQNFDLSSSSSSRSSRSPEASKGLCKGNEPVKQENRQLSSGFMCEAE